MKTHPNVLVSLLVAVIAVTFALAGQEALRLATSVAPGMQVAQVGADKTAPTTPATLTATPGPTSIELSWSASTDNVGVVGYRVFRNSSVIATTTSTSYTDTNLVSTTAYTYFIRAIDAANNSSGNSPVRTATTTVLSVGGTTGQVDIKADFGATCNGVASDSLAFANFYMWAQEWQKTNSATIRLSLPAGGTCYINEQGTASYIARFFAKGIKNLVVEGNGATLKNGPTSHGLFLGSLGQIQNDRNSARLETVNAGASSVTLKDSTKMSLFKVGNWVLITGYDLQGLWGSPYGYPSNAHFFEFVQIASVSGNTVTFTAPLKYTYLSTWPNYNSGHTWEVDNGGPATLYALDPSWDAQRTYRNMTIDAGTLGQLYANGRSSTFENVTFTAAGVIPTQNSTFTLDNVTMNAYVEVDKFVDKLIIKNSTVGSMDFQSTSVNDFYVNDSRFERFLNGTPKRAYITDTYMKQFGPGALYYGVSDEVVCTNCQIDKFVTFGTRMPVTNYTMTNGVMRIPNQDDAIPWGIPGTHAFFSGSHSGFWPFTVLETTQDANYTYIKTDLPGGLPPTNLRYQGTGLNVLTPPVKKFTCTNCTGDPVVVDLSQAPAGAPLWSYSKRTYTGASSAASNYLTMRGKVVSIKVNVTKPYTGTKTATLEAFGQFGAFFLDNTTNTVMDTNRPNPKINLKVAGERTFLPGTTTGLKTGDVGVTLPAESSILGNFGAYITDMRSEDPSVWPSVTIEVITDQGFGSGTGSARGTSSVIVIPPDVSAPAVSIVTPASGVTLSPTTIQTTLQVNTSETATCKYSTNASAAFNSMTQFSNTGSGTTHSTLLQGLSTATYTYYVKCQDTTGNVSNNFTTTFTIPTAVEIDVLAPAVTVTAPLTNLASTITQTTLSVSTSEAATCRYGDRSSSSYSSMDAFTTTGATAHSVLLTGLEKGTSYQYYIKCRDAAGNTSDNASVSFEVAGSGTNSTPTNTTSSSGGGGGGGGGSKTTTTKTTTKTTTSTSNTTNTTTSGNTTPVATVTSTAGGGSGSGAKRYVAAQVSQGASGESVTAAQELLVSRGELSIPAGTSYGYFGGLTKSAVIAFQLKESIITSANDPGAGSIGPKTLARMNALIGGSAGATTPVSSPAATVPVSSVSSGGGTSGAFSQNLSVGSSGVEVSTLQALLKAKGYFSGEPTGYYGPLTQASVALMQKVHGIEAVGSVGPITRALLNGGAVQENTGAPAAAAQAPATQTPVTTPTTAAPTVVVPAVQTSTQSGFVVGGTVRTKVEVDIYLQPGGNILGFEPAGTTGVIVGGPVTEGGKVWWKLRYSNGYYGWTPQDLLSR